MSSAETIEDVAVGLISAVVGCSNVEGERSCRPKEEGRFAWGSLGDIIEAAPFLPVTINVPDMIYAAYEMFHRVMDYFYGSESESDESTPRIWDIIREIEDELPEF